MTPTPSRNVNLLRIPMCSIAFKVVGIVASVTVVDAAQTDPARAQFYSQNIKPVLRERCYACHGALKQEAGLRLDSAQLLLQGGDNGTIVSLSQPSDSLLLRRITASSADFRMPPEGHPLTPEQISAIARWLDRGAPAPADEAPEEDPSHHWAFQAPAVSRFHSSDNGQATAIDALIDRSRRSLGEVPVDVASQGYLLRRLYVDLIGFPPDLAELLDFCADTRADAYERAVDRLLSSPQHGERWARHWMDIWRYSDWYGLGQQLRYSQKHIWHWRDWIVEAVNADKGYDQMIVEMLAGDELAALDQPTLRATGFLARNYYLFNRTTWLDNTIEHTSQAFLGLTMQCAKCHDHKYDPISQLDYYRLRAIFEPHQVRLDVVAGEADLEQNGLPRVFDGHPEAQTFLHIRGDEKAPDTDRVIHPGTPKILTFADYRPRQIDLPLAAHWPGALEHALPDQLHRADEQIEQARRAVQRRHERLQQVRASQAAQAELQIAETAYQVAEKELAVASRMPQKIKTAFQADRARMTRSTKAEALAKIAARAARHFELAQAELQVARSQLAILRAQDKQAEENNKVRQKLENDQAQLKKARQAVQDPGHDYEPFRASLKALEGPAETPASRDQPYPAQSTGRRLAFARWIVHPDNPLTARVAANHVWLRHLGQPLVDPVTDFGRRAKPPLQQPLLDWLAITLKAEKWSLKRLHRSIVLSHVYRLASSARGPEPGSAGSDPTNAAYGRRLPTRMQSQVVRDSLLRLADQLDLALGGPSLEVTEDPASKSFAFRRSLYFKHSRDDQHAFLTMFDDADILSCYRRSQSIVPQQALALANARLSLSMSERIAQRLVSMVKDLDRDQADEGFTQRAFLLLLCREPTDLERAACLQSLRGWRELFSSGDAQWAYETPREFRNLVHALVNHNDFISIR